MSGMIDGVNKVFTVQHRDRSMHIEGFANERDMVERVMGLTRLEHTPRDCVAWLESLKGKIDETILRIKQDWEIDGHRRPEVPDDE